MNRQRSGDHRRHSFLRTPLANGRVTHAGGRCRHAVKREHVEVFGLVKPSLVRVYEYTTSTPLDNHSVEKADIIQIQRVLDTLAEQHTGD